MVKVPHSRVRLSTRLTRSRLRSLVFLLGLFALLAVAVSRLALELVPALLLAIIALFDFTPAATVARLIAERRYKRLSARRAFKRVLLPLRPIVMTLLVLRVSASALAMRPPPAPAQLPN